MPTTEKTSQIIHAFNTHNDSEIFKYSTQDLQDAIVDLGDINKSDRTAIQFEIDGRNKRDDRKYQSYIRALSYIAVLAIGVISGYFGAKL